MILNSKNSLYKLRFPKNFFQEEIKEKYNEYLKHYPTPFKDIVEFVNHTIQEVSIPNYTPDVTEPQQTGTFLPPIHPPGGPASWKLQRYFTIKLKHTEAFINWFFLNECIYDWVTVGKKSNHLPELKVSMLTSDFLEVASIKFGMNVHGGLSESLNLNSTELRNVASNFTMTIWYNDFDIVFNNSSIIKK